MELGMGDYEMRSYKGWNRHMLLTMMAHLFLWTVKIELEDAAPSLTLPQVRILLKAVLPLKEPSTLDTIHLVKWIQEKNHKAYLSHRKKKIEKNISGEDVLMDCVMG
jgi:hypothetical protein